MRVRPVSYYRSYLSYRSYRSYPSYRNTRLELIHGHRVV